MLLRNLICVLLVSVMAACSAKYRPAVEGSSVGYRDFKVTPSAYVVEYTEHYTVPWKQIHRFAIQRSAELAETLGYAYFEVKKKTEQTVFFKNSVNEMRVPMAGNPQGDVAQLRDGYTYVDGGANTEGRRVIYEVIFSNE